MSGSQPGNLRKGLGIPRESDFVGQWEFIPGLPQDWGNRDSTLGGWEQDTNKLWLAPRPREEQ